MKRELTALLLGAALIVPADAEAQRAKGRVDDGPRVLKVAPVRAPGRVTGGGPRADVRPRPRARRVVYTTHTAYRAPRLHRPLRDRRVRVRLEWDRAPFHFRAPRFQGRVGPGELRRILGPRTVSRVRRAGRRVGLRGAVRGYWIDSWRHGVVLVATMEGIDVAEFIDYDCDGRIDDAFFLRAQAARGWIGHP